MNSKSGRYPLNHVRGRRETLTLGVVNTIAPALITGFVTRPPPAAYARIGSPANHARRGIERLLSGQIDGCFSADPIAGNTKMVTIGMFHERLLLAMAQGRALASQTSVSLSDLSEQP